MLPRLTLVLGGAASGKSAFAESLAKRTGGPLTYLATAQVFDDEMQDKVARHRAERGAGWRTIEEPFDVGRALAKVEAHETVLLDCATMWLSNHLLAETPLAEVQGALVSGLAECPASVIVVSNETGQSVVPENALARRFRQAQGELNQVLASKAGLVVNVIAGLPLVLKGDLP
ncbi:bifunctional adenosylcobinamide kinase/adenosylcobinamide-phosphate guanylyltransferase [Roseovarius sp. MMSF_3281]|uniref:bifunctional adenosylcobinamide kinase/adenosylcobinamide-phosphate guanylyltransferase n=1 Tax=Roseovarius sp. MMSF_3281 TaxID=3046694 RepID=UPI00273D27CD|nr:bifunctional adenosylcobinamide kinase/adenosylcobinamide-phosphate guanylyltransferase [Roseovarius sp. MMSF_3281]